MQQAASRHHDHVPLKGMFDNGVSKDNVTCDQLVSIFEAASDVKDTDPLMATRELALLHFDVQTVSSLIDAFEEHGRRGVMAVVCGMDPEGYTTLTT